MMHMNHLPHPTKCFCQIPSETIRKWIIERYIKNRTTIDLLGSVSEPLDKEAISAVALVDADDSTLLQMMGNVDLPDHHILHCREQAKKLIEELRKESGHTRVVGR
jgi:hypothetical protein